jgi:hypothetical protein
MCSSIVAQDPQRGVISTTHSRTYPHLQGIRQGLDKLVTNDPLYWVLLRVMRRWGIKIDQANVKARSANAELELFDKSSAWR